MKQAALNIMRITTRHDLLACIARHYAMDRGIDPEEFVKLSIREQLHFRRCKSVRHAIARKLGLRK